jgi:hypothetical protein
VPSFGGTTPKQAAMFRPLNAKGANVERAQSLPEQRYAVKEYFPIAATRRLLIFFYSKLTCGHPLQLYYCGYLTSFILGTVCVIAAIVK